MVEGSSLENCRAGNGTVGSNPTLTARIDSGILYRYYKNMRITQRKGDIAVAQAIASFTKLGLDVSLPLTESAPYDLVVDIANILKRVQVRYTSSNQVDLRRVHSNANGYVVKKTKENAYDWLYILKNTGEEYLVKKCLSRRRSFNPSDECLLKNKL